MPYDGENEGRRPDTSFFDAQQRQPGPQQPPAWSRAARAVAGLVPATMIMLMMLLILEAIAPAGVKPSKLIGNLMGSIHNAEINAQQETVVGNTYRMADAQARANANAQMSIIEMQQQMQTIKDALAAKVTEANAADVACIAGSLAAAFLFDNGSDSQRTSRQVGATGCALATKLRQDIAQEQAQLARTYALLMQAGGR